MDVRWEPFLFELAKLVVLSMLMERSLALIFDHKFYREHLDGKGWSAPIAFVASWAVCHQFKFDLPTFLFDPGNHGASGPGIFLTAAMVAGGSAGAIKLFQGVLGLDKSVTDRWREAKIMEAEAALAEARAQKNRAGSGLRDPRQAEGGGNETEEPPRPESTQGDRP